MATMNPNMSERRHIPERRTIAGTSGKRMTAIDWIPMLLLIVGGINWGLIGLMDFNLVAYLFGDDSVITRAIYGLVGLSALYSIYLSSRLSSKNAH